MDDGTGNVRARCATIMRREDRKTVDLVKPLSTSIDITVNARAPFDMIVGSSLPTNGY